tara:strand:+ start:407 stop:1288 length:882 start_codon:yes stop_codon:yes gene_type:complete
MENNNKRKGIVLAGGTGSRLYPLTSVISKQLLPVYNKPMIFYPISTLMLAGIREILIITTPEDLDLFKKLLGDGYQWGVEFSYQTQKSPDGLAQAFLIAEDFINGDKCALILGDNIFYGPNIEKLLINANMNEDGATLFIHSVKDPERYGVAECLKNKVLSIEEKPVKPKSNNVVTGLYFYDANVVEYAKNLKPSKRGELEITDLNNIYLESNNLFVEILGSQYCWLDAGTHDSLLEAGQFVSSIEKKQNLKIASLDEIAYQKRWISKAQISENALLMKDNDYGFYLKQLINK